MSLPLHTRAMALVVAVSTTSAIIITVAELGHPPADGYGAIATLLLPESMRTAPMSLVTLETGTLRPPGTEMPQP
jgi:hypothetical protein